MARKQMEIEPNSQNVFVSPVDIDLYRDLKITESYMCKRMTPWLTKKMTTMILII